MTKFGSQVLTAQDLADEFGPPDVHQSIDGTPRPRTVAAAPNIEWDTRTERMVAEGLRNFPVTVLVGPPGTGKNRAIQSVIADVRASPAKYGFAPHAGSPQWPSILELTPNEATTLRDLVGVWLPNQDGQLIWSMGLLLDALMSDGWLLIDELNRGDLDKILGPLLTWLGGARVTLGRLTPAPTAPRLVLDWALHSPESYCSPSAEIVQQLLQGGASDDGHAEIVFYAGRDFRILGAFNPRDTALVFPMGEAVTRRLRTVPMPSIAVDRFRRLLEARMPFPSLPLTRAIIDLYEAHRTDTATELGPAVFLEMADYFQGQGDDVALDDLRELLEEAYVISAGRFFGSYSDRARSELVVRLRDIRLSDAIHGQGGPAASPGRQLDVPIAPITGSEEVLLLDLAWIEAQVDTLF